MAKGASFVKRKTDGTNLVPSATAYRIFLSVFVFLRYKWKRDRKRDGIHRDQDRKRLSVFPSVLPVSRFWPGYSRFHPVYTFTGTSAEAVEPSCAVSGRSARLASALFGCMQNITLLVTRTCMYLTKTKSLIHVCIYVYVTQQHVSNVSFFYVLCVKAAYHKRVKHKKIKHGYTRVF